MALEAKCPKCLKIKSLSEYTHNIMNLETRRRELWCKECAEEKLKQDKEKYFVEEYKNREIYLVNGKFISFTGNAFPRFTNYESLDSIKKSIDEEEEFWKKEMNSPEQKWVEGMRSQCVPPENL